MNGWKPRVMLFLPMAFLQEGFRGNFLRAFPTDGANFSVDVYSLQPALELFAGVFWASDDKWRQSEEAMRTLRHCFLGDSRLTWAKRGTSLSFIIATQVL